MKRHTSGISHTAVCAALALVLIATGCSEKIGKGWDWNRMRVQPRYEPYRASTFFANGMAMQAPPPGTISREASVGALAAAPLVITPAVLQLGAYNYHIYCAVCHGERGDAASYVARSMDQPKPPALVTPPVSLMPDSLIVAIIGNGIGRMPSFAAELTPADRQAVAAYVKKMQATASGVATDSGTAAPGRSPQ
jgi:mono/diheme cytochrome c family protein